MLDNIIFNNIFPAGEDGEDPRIVDDVPTPDGLLSVSGSNMDDSRSLCPEGLSIEDHEKCIREQQKQKIESPKRRFFIQIRLFDEFWNMALPVCNERGVNYVEIGMADETNAREKAIAFWDQLESRFELKARRISENELKEEDEEIHESLMKWGQPYEYNNPKGIPISRESSAGVDNKKQNAKNNQDSDEDDYSEE